MTKPHGWGSRREYRRLCRSDERSVSGGRLLPTAALMKKHMEVFFHNNLKVVFLPLCHLAAADHFVIGGDYIPAGDYAQ